MMDSLERSLAELRVELSPSNDDKARLRGRILPPALGVERIGVEGRGDEALPRTRWALMKATGGTGLAAGALLLGVGLGTGFWIGRAANAPLASAPAHVEPPRAPLQASDSLEATPQRLELPPSRPAVAVVEPPQAEAAAPTAANGEPPSMPRRPHAHRRRLQQAAPSPLNDELALLRRVERALRNADPALALALLAELDERFPDTRLIEERQAARLLAGCRLNDPMALARAHAFLHDNPASVYRQRVQLACESGAAAPQKPIDAAPLKDGERPGH